MEDPQKDNFGVVMPPADVVSPASISDAKAPVPQPEPIALEQSSENLLETNPTENAATEVVYVHQPSQSQFIRKHTKIISLAVVLFLALSSLLVLGLTRGNQEDAAVNRGAKQTIPVQDSVFGSQVPNIPSLKLEGEDPSLIVGGDIISKSALKVSNNGFMAILKSQTLTANRQYLLPDSQGTVCLDSNNCGYALLSQLNSLNAQVAQLATQITPATDLSGVQSQLGSLQSQLGQIAAPEVPPASLLNNQAGAVSIQGVSNQISVTTSNGVITLAAPQDLAPLSSPSFANLLLSGNFDIGGTLTLPFDCSGQINGGALTTNASGEIVCSADDGGAGTGVTTTGGTIGAIPMFSGAQQIADSIIAQNLGTISIGGDLDVSSNLSAASLTLAAPLAVSEGGTGLTSFTPNGVLIGSGAGGIAATTAPTAGQILLGNAGGQPVFSTISGDIAITGAGVTTIQPDSIALGVDTTGNYTASINAGAGIDVVGVPGEGTNYTLSVVYGSAANTAVEGDTSITVTAGSNISGGGIITLGAGGSLSVATVNDPVFTTSVTAPIFVLTGAGSSGTIQVATLGQSTTYVLPDVGVASAEFCLSTGNCVGGAGGAPNNAAYLTIGGNATLTGERSISLGANLTANDGGANGAYTLNTVDNPVFGTSVTTPLIQSSGALSISAAGMLSAGTVSNATLLQGSMTTITSNGAGNDIVLTTADQIRLTGFNCSVLGNGGKLTTDASGNLVCDDEDGGPAGSVTSPGGSTGRLALFTGTNTIADSWILQNGSTIELDATRNLSLLGGNFSVVGGGIFSGLLTANGGISIGAGQSFALNGDSFTDLTGTGLTVSSGSLQTTLGTSIELTSEVNGVLPVANGGTGVGTTPASGQLLVGNGSGYSLATISAGAGITVTNGAGSITVTNNFGNEIDLGAETTGNYQAGSTGGNGISVVGTIGEGWTPTFNLGNLTSDWSQSGAFDIILNNADSQLSILESAGGTYFGTIDVGDLSANRTYTFPDASGTICLDTGNCAGTGGGVTTPGGTPNQLAKFTAGGVIADSSISDNGSTVSTSSNIVIQGGSATIGTLAQNGSLSFYESGFLATLQPGTLTGARSYTLPDGSGEICVSGLGNCSGVGSGNAPSGAQYITLALDGTLTSERVLSFNATNLTVSDGGANGVYSVNTIQNINTSAAPSFAGLTVTTADITASAGNINAATGSLQTNGTTRITAGGVLQNVSNADAGTFFTGGTLGISRGGTNATSVGAAGSVAYSSGSAYAFTGVGSSGQCLVSNGSGTPTWASCAGTGSGVTLQAAYDNSSDPEIVVDATRGALTIRDNIVPIGNNLFEVQNNAGGVTYFAVDTSGTDINGQLTVVGTASISGVLTLGAQASAGTQAVRADRTLTAGDGLTGGGDLTNNRTFAVDATVCRTTGNCAGVGGTGDILQGGNSFGAAVTIGSNDNFGLNLETNGVTRLAISNTGVATFTSSVTATSFSGDGASLTNLNADNLASGTVPSARVAGAYTGITGTGTLTSGAIGSGFGNINIGTNTFTGNGSGLTNLDGSNIATGTVANARLVNGGALTVVAGSGLINGGSVALGGSATLTVGAGDGITVNADDVAVDATVCRTTGNCAGVGGTGDILQGGNSFGAAMTIGTNDSFDLNLETNGVTRVSISSTGAASFTGSLSASSFTGNGSGLTNLDGSNIATGTVANARLVNGGALTVSAGTGLTGGGSVLLGGTTTINLGDTTVSPSTYGSATQVASFTVDAQGRLTAATNVSIAINANQVTTGTLSVVRGGTGAGTFTTNGVLYGNGTGTLGVTAAGTTGQCLTATTGNPPTWGDCNVGAVTTIGAIDSQSKSANGASISGSTLYMQTADATNPGLVSTGTQTIAGDKTFTGNTTNNANEDTLGSVATRRGTDFSTTGTINNANFSNASLIRLTGASTQTLTGIANGRDGYQLTLINASNQSALLNNESASSLAANRIITGTGGTVPIPAGASISLIYDSGASRWRVIGSPQGNGVAAGSIVAMGTTTAPSGYLVANGSCVSETTYPELFAAIANSYSTPACPGGQFRLPDMRGRVAAGAGANGVVHAAYGGNANGTNTIGITNLPTTNPYTYTVGSTSTSTTTVVMDTFNAGGPAMGEPLGNGNPVAGQAGGTNYGFLAGATTNWTGLFFNAATTTTTTTTLSSPGCTGCNATPFNIQDPYAGVTYMIATTQGAGTTSMTNVFNQGGNSFGSDAILGTNDAFNLIFETNGSERLRVTTAGNVGINNNNSLYKLSVVNEGGTVGSSQINLNNSTTDSGAYLLGYTNAGVSAGLMSAGASFNGTNWIAKNTTASIFGGAGGAFQIYTNSGLTAGNSFTPSLRFNMDSLGNTAIADNIDSNYRLKVGGGVLTNRASGALDSLRVEIDGTAYFRVQGNAQTYVGNRLGVGNTTPDTTLEVTGGLCVSDNAADNCTTAAGEIRADGAVTANAFDLAERYGSTQNLAPGTIVAIDDSNDMYVKEAGDRQSTIGVVSTNPGFTLGWEDNEQLAGAPYKTLVALAGRVPVSVSASNGVISRGDPISLSAVSGVGERATTPGQIIGYALSGYSGGGVGTVEVFVSPGYWAPLQYAYLQNGDAATLSNLQVTGTLDASSLNVSGATTLTTLTVTGDATIQGTLTVTSIEVGSITVGGHIITAGDTPEAQVLGAAGQSATYTIDGNDTAGTITITTGTTAITPGDLIKVTFNQSFGKVPKIVLSPQDEATADAKIFPNSKTANDYMLKTSQTLPPNTSYTFDYFIVE